MKYSIAATVRTGKRSFIGKLAQDKATARIQLERMVLAYGRDNGMITVCRPGIAKGASFNRNQHPRNGLKGVDRPSIYA